MSPLQQQTVFHNLLSRFEQQRHSVHAQDASYERLWNLLCAAHIAGQTVILFHLKAHRAMLSLAWQHKQWAEVGGQLLRLALVLPGNLLHQLPIGNTGRADISAFKTMTPPVHLQSLIEEAAKIKD